MPHETFTSPVLQAAHEITLGWRREPNYYGHYREEIFIEQGFNEEELLTLARSVIAAYEAKEKS